jgi:hypothetical protein
MTNYAQITLFETLVTTNSNTIILEMRIKTALLVSHEDKVILMKC